MQIYKNANKGYEDAKMNKKRNWSLSLLILLLLFSFTACGGEGIEETEITEIISAAETEYSQEDVTVKSQEEIQIESTELNETIASADIKENLVTKSVEMEVHYIDVGQGDATLIINGDSSMLIDAGNNDKGTKVQLYLEKQGIEKLDYVIGTHADADHFGGLDVILTKFPTETIILSEIRKDTATCRDVWDTMNNKGYKNTTPIVGDTYQLDDAFFTIIAPNKEYSEANDNSVAILLSHGENSFLFTGDAEEESETDIINNGKNIQADVYKVGHHGSSSSSSTSFLEKVQPTYAVISCSDTNSYGHPHSQTLNNLRSIGVQLFRTDEQGSLIATSNGKTLKWNSLATETWQAGESTENSQPHVDVKKEESTPMVETPAIEEPIVEEVATSENGYILNTNSKKFHFMDCGSGGRTSAKNRKDVTDTRENIIAMGYEPCGNCEP